MAHGGADASPVHIVAQSAKDLWSGAASSLRSVVRAGTEWAGMGRHNPTAWPTQRTLQTYWPHLEPTVPAPYHPCASALQDVALLSSLVSIGQAWVASPSLPSLSLALAGGWVAAASQSPKSGGAWALLPRRVVEQREWWRLATAPMLHASWPQLACNVASLLPEACIIQAARGTFYLGWTLVACTLLSQALYVAVTWAAHQLGAPSKLTAAYQSPGVLTSSSLVLALKVVGGYLAEPPRPAPAPGGSRTSMVDDDLFAGVSASPFSQGRQSAWLTLGWIQTVTKGQSPVPDVCGILAGLALVYGEAALSSVVHRWRRRQAGVWGALAGSAPRMHACPGLGWPDVLGQVTIGAGTLVMLGLARGK
uniref:Peptidase S54 rhomboid domain-containing protein n=1 Tax=Auxenochlorella protothecoides TaxID=3075 RepID=A0A1D1ZT70_AUXPR